MIKGFRDKETQKLFRGRKSKAVSQQAARKAMQKLAQLNRVSSAEEMGSPPSNKLHKLSGNREGQWSVNVDKQYRICFRFEDGNAYDVEAVDYH